MYISMYIVVYFICNVWDLFENHQIGVFSIKLNELIWCLGYYESKVNYICLVRKNIQRAKSIFLSYWTKEDILREGGLSLAV